MKTRIYNTRAEFSARADKKENGVSAVFATLHPAFEKENATNESCWNCSGCSGCSRCSGCYGCYRCSDCYDCYGCSDCSDCSDCSRCSDCSDCSRCSGCSGCSRCSDCSRCSGCSDCSGCYGCYRCSDCYDCYDCSRCSDCYGCYDCYGLKNSKPVEAPAAESWFNVPVIPRLHQTVLEAVSKPDSLDMGGWHTCDTTHCRAGWVVFLAGEKGKKLEKASSTLFAAMQICKASSPIKVSPIRFFETDEVAMADIKRCAEEERAAAPGDAGKGEP